MWPCLHQGDKLGGDVAEVNMQDFGIQPGQVKDPLPEFGAVHLPWLLKNLFVHQPPQPPGSRLFQDRQTLLLPGKGIFVLAIVGEHVGFHLLEAVELAKYLHHVALEEISDVGCDDGLFRH